MYTKTKDLYTFWIFKRKFNK